MYGRQFHILESQVRHLREHFTIIRLNMLLETVTDMLQNTVTSDNKVQCFLAPDSQMSPIGTIFRD